jgi:raffinose/stachyose/melibiose transport system permease protein
MIQERKRSSTLRRIQQLETRRARVGLGARLGQAGLYAVLIIWAAITLVPLLWMFVASFRTTSGIYNAPFSLPHIWRFVNFVQAWQLATLGHGLLNSALVSVGSVILATVCALLVGFALSRGGLPFSQGILTFFLLGLMVPIFSLLIPLLILFIDIHLLNTYLGLIMVYAGFSLPLGVFLCKNAFDALPQELIDAAVMDGCSVPRLLIQVLVPLVGSVIATFAILAFLNGWNDFIFVLILISETSHETLPLHLMVFSGEYATNYGELFAALSIATIPTLVLYFWLSDRIQTGMGAGVVR